MSMPNHLVLVRHGLSEGNLATEASKNGDHSYYTDAFTTTPGRQWRLAPQGRTQAEVAGRWVADNIASVFDRYYVSPYVRTRETAALLGLDGAAWRYNRALRERDWGDIGSLRRDEFESNPIYALNAQMKRNDPLYWTPPGGESIAHVAEDRVRNVCDTLHRECGERSVVCVTHGELMWAFRVVLERLDDDTFQRLDADPAEKIHNCEVLHYTRVAPPTATNPGELAPRLAWLRRAAPFQDDEGRWQMRVSPWVEFFQYTYSNDELLAGVADIPTLFDDRTLSR